MIHLQVIDDILVRINTQGYLQDKPAFIRWLIKSERLPEYIAGAIAAGEGIAGDEYSAIKSFVLEALHQVSDAPGEKFDDFNRHLFRHALMVLPMAAANLPPEEMVTVSHPGCKTPVAFNLRADAWREAIFAYLGSEFRDMLCSEALFAPSEPETASCLMDCVDNVPAETRAVWISLKIQQLENELAKKRNALHHNRNALDKAESSSNEEDAQKARSAINGIEAAIRRFESDKRDIASGAPSEETASGHLSGDEWPSAASGGQRTDPISSLHDFDLWSISSLLIGVAEMASAPEARFLVQYCRLKARWLSLCRKGTRPDLGVLAYVMCRLWPRFPEYRGSITDAIEDLAMALPFVSSDTISGYYYAQHLAVLRFWSTAHGSDNQFDNAQIDSQTHAFLTAHLPLPLGMAVAAPGGTGPTGKALGDFVSAVCERLAVCSNKRFETPEEWVPCIESLAWIVLSGTGDSPRSHYLRLSQKLTTVFSLFGGGERSDEMFQSGARLLKDLLCIALSDEINTVLWKGTLFANIGCRETAPAGAGEQGTGTGPEAMSVEDLKRIANHRSFTLFEVGRLLSEHRDTLDDETTKRLRRLIHTSFIHIFPIIKEWWFPRTVGKDIATTLTHLLEHAEICEGHKVLRTMVSMMEHARMDRDLVQEMMHYCRSENLMRILKAIDAIEELLMQPSQPDESAGATLKQLYLEIYDSEIMADKMSQYAMADILEDIGFDNRDSNKLPKTLMTFMITRIQKTAFYSNAGFAMLDRNDIHGQAFMEYKERMSYIAEKQIHAYLNIRDEIRRRWGLADTDRYDDLQQHHADLNRLMESFQSLESWCFQNLSHIQRRLVFIMLRKRTEPLRKKLDMVSRACQIINKQDEAGAVALLEKWRDRALSPGKADKSVRALIRHIERWRQHRGMFHELAVAYEKRGERRWGDYRRIFNLWTALAIIILPYVIYGLTKIMDPTLPKFVSQIGFSVYWSALNLMFVVIVLWLFLWMGSRALTDGVWRLRAFSGYHRFAMPLFKNANRPSMLLPKALGLVFLAYLGIGTSDETWRLASASTQHIIRFGLFCFFYLGGLYAFISRVLLRDWIIEKPEAHRRTRVLMSILLLQSFVVVFFFSGHWAGNFSNSITEVPKKTVSAAEAVDQGMKSTEQAGLDWFADKFLPKQVIIAVQKTEPMYLLVRKERPEVVLYPRIILFWTLQVAFAGIVLQLFIGKDRIT